ESAQEAMRHGAPKKILRFENRPAPSFALLRTVRRISAISDAELACIAIQRHETASWHLDCGQRAPIHSRTLFRKERDMSRTKVVLMIAAVIVLLLGGSKVVSLAVTVTQAPASDPGVRCGDLGAGGPIDGLTTDQAAFFTAGQEDFQETEAVA